MRRLRALLPFGQPVEVVFFLFLAAFALVITIIYWFVSYEPAGTMLLVGFTIATGALGIILALDPRAAAVRERAARMRRDKLNMPPDIMGRDDMAGEGPTAEGTAGVDRPFLDEAGRLPAPTLAPFAVGLGVSTAATGAIFGLAPVLVGLLPLAWGAWTWLAGAGEELAATERSRRLRATYVQDPEARREERPPDGRP